MPTEDERRASTAYKRAWYARNKAANTPAYQRLIASQRRYNAAHKPPRSVWWHDRHKETPQ